jgi:predicted DNA-binding WGR domain protein
MQPHSYETRRWTTASRYYCARVQQDLFGDWELVRAWGGLGSRFGGLMTEPAQSLEDALARLALVARRREQRGYRNSMAETG